MSILLLLIPLSLMLVGIAAWAFAWAVRRGQFDDLDTPALDILGDDHRESDTSRGHRGTEAADDGYGGNGSVIHDGDHREADPDRGRRGIDEADIGSNGDGGGNHAD